jgi:hypothetical protein
LLDADGVAGIATKCASICRKVAYKQLQDGSSPQEFRAKSAGGYSSGWSRSRCCVPGQRWPLIKRRSAPAQASSTQAIFVSSLFEGPQAYRVPSAPESKFLTRDFRPRGASIADADSRLNPADGDLVHDNTVWQRLAEYRTHDRVRVLTLWESGASTVSLQAGRKGDPSLQWTSRLMNRGGATHGLLDRLFPVSVFGEHSAARVTQHPANAQPTGKPAASLGALRIGPP